VSNFLICQPLEQIVPPEQNEPDMSAMKSYKTILCTIYSILKSSYPVKKELLEDIVKDFRTFQPLLLKSKTYSNLYIELDPQENQQFFIVYTTVLDHVYKINKYNLEEDHQVGYWYDLLTYFNFKFTLSDGLLDCKCKLIYVKTLHL
jgi:hypothetical protein